MMSNHLPPLPILYQHPTLLKIDYTVWSQSCVSSCVSFLFREIGMDPKKKVLGLGVISLALCFYIPLVQLLGPPLL